MTIGDFALAWGTDYSYQLIKVFPAESPTFKEKVDFFFEQVKANHDIPATVMMKMLAHRSEIEKQLCT